MSGLEIVGAIAGIVSAIVAVGNAIKKARRERKAALQESTKALETQLVATLDNGPPRINNEYNRDVARIGPSFSRGDGKNCPIYKVISSDAIIAIANGQLMSIMVEVNASLVNVINSFVAAGQFTFTPSNYQTWNRAGSKTTEDTVTALAQLYQRQLQAAPFPLNLLSPAVSKVEEVKDVHWPYAGGGYYKGEVVDGKRHGYGMEHWPDGDTYEGNFIKNKREGYGKYTYSDGGCYTGEWKANNKHGHGLQVWKSRDSYNGEWLNNVKHGEGVYKYADGRIRKGIWKNGVEWD